MIYGIPEAKVIADSISQDGHRLTTIEAKIHRFILAELNTHRMFSRNSASSRAIPARKIRQMVVDDPAMPVWWGKNQAGMQAPEELIGLQKEDAINGWLKARDTAVLYHMELESIGLHKQITNRILEPWLWHRVIISATEWDNFFWQRYHKHAQPEMRAAAEFIHKVYSESTPVLRVKPTDTSIIGNVVGIKRAWHLPYITEVERESLLTLSELRAISVGRCCRVSYLNHDGVRDPEADIALYDKLISQFPGHWSPLEHVAVVTDAVDQTTRNFRGWRQLRGLVEPPVPKFKKG